MTTLVSPGVTLGAGVVLWPRRHSTILGTGQLSVGPGAILYPGARLVAEHSHISVGAGTEIGEEGGFTIKSGGSDVVIGREVRLLGGGSLSFANTIGDGAQILRPSAARIAHSAQAARTATLSPMRGARSSRAVASHAVSTSPAARSFAGLRLVR